MNQKRPAVAKDDVIKCLSASYSSPLSAGFVVGCGGLWCGVA